MPLFPSRRWLQFSVRTLLVVMTVIAAVLAYHVKWTQDRRAFLSRNSLNSVLFNTGESHSAPPLLGLVGEAGVAWMILEGDEELEIARSLFPESNVQFIKCFPTPGTTTIFEP